MSTPFATLPVPRWVTSDTHLGHAKILDYCPWRRTWAADIKAHDESIIAAWNRVVGAQDWVLHLGDVAFGSAGQIWAYRRRLNGRICVVLGNHDRTRTSMLGAGFDVVVGAGVIIADGSRWICRHDPALVSAEDALGATRLLHGHHHGDTHRGQVPAHLCDLARDCGIDALRSPGPVAWDSVR